MAEATSTSTGSRDFGVATADECGDVCGWCSSGGRTSPLAALIFFELVAVFCFEDILGVSEGAKMSQSRGKDPTRRAPPSTKFNFRNRNPVLTSPIVPQCGCGKESADPSSPRLDSTLPFSRTIIPVSTPGKRNNAPCDHAWRCDVAEQLGEVARGRQAGDDGADGVGFAMG